MITQKLECGQSIENASGRIKISKKGWLVRSIVLLIYAFLVAYILYNGIFVQLNWLLVYSVVMPLSDLLDLMVGWILYRNPVPRNVFYHYSKTTWPLVSVIVPIYNQQEMIRDVIEAIFHSTYENIEVIAVNDGSKDGTAAILDDMDIKIPGLKVIHTPNGGKRRAVATGFYASKGKYLVMIDSDSVVDREAISEFVKAFEADPKVGGAVGHIKVGNADLKLITKFQDVWYDFSFNVTKAAESYFNSVICLSGCLAAYRREAIKGFIPYWASIKVNRVGEDKEVTMYTLAPDENIKTELKTVFGGTPWSGWSQNLMESAAQYDDSEDRILSAHSIISWKNVYVASAVGYTYAPETAKQFFKQQTRWKKSWLRTNFFLNAFFWRKHPIVALHYYILFLSTITMPLITVINFVYVPLFLHNWGWVVTILAGGLLAGLMQGVDYHLRDSGPASKHWLWKPIALFFTSHVVMWLLIPAIINYRKNNWGTR